MTLGGLLFQIRRRLRAGVRTSWYREVVRRQIVNAVLSAERRTMSNAKSIFSRLQLTGRMLVGHCGPFTVLPAPLTRSTSMMMVLFQ